MVSPSYSLGAGRGEGVGVATGWTGQGVGGGGPALCWGPSSYGFQKKVGYMKVSTKS